MAVEVKVLENFSNGLLERNELVMSIEHHMDSTPRKDVITMELSKNYNIPKEQIMVFGLCPEFGIHRTKAFAHMYKSKKKMDEIENICKLLRLRGETKERPCRRTRKDEKNKRAKMFGTLKRNMKKAAKRTK